MTETIEQTGNVFTALAHAQAQMGAAVKNANNPHFKAKYADLAEVVSAVRPALTAVGISFRHEMLAMDGGQFAVDTILNHGASATSISSGPVPLLVGKQDMQGFKSAVTYAKRIGLESVTGVAPEDDDGNAAVASPPRAPQPVQKEQGPPPPPPGFDHLKAFKAIEAHLPAVLDVEALNALYKGSEKTIGYIRAASPTTHETLISLFAERKAALAQFEPADQAPADG